MPNTITLDGVTHLVTDSITLEDLRIFIATHPTQLAPTGTPLPTSQWIVIVTAGGKDHRHPFRQEGDARHYYAECVANGYATRLESDGIVVQSTESDGMYVVSDPNTGWSDETMRFATLSEAEAWIAQSDDPSGYSWRYES